MTVHFTIPGEPVAKGRPRSDGHGRMYTPPKTRKYEEYVRATWLRSTPPALPTGQPLRVFIDAYFSIPKSATKKQKSQMDGAPHIKKPDIDNVAKIVMDAICGVAYKDDAVISELTARKWNTLSEPRVEVTLEWEENNGGV